MDKAKAQAMPFETLLSTALCKCMRADCPNLHWADLSPAQHDQLERHWEHTYVHPWPVAGGLVCGWCAAEAPAERGWPMERVFGACVLHPGLRALAVFGRSVRYAEVFAEVRRLLVPEIDVQVTARGHVLTFPNGAVLRLLALDGADAMRVVTGAVFHLVVFDGLGEEDVAYVASRVRSADAPLLGAHRLAEAEWRAPQPRIGRWPA